MVKGDFMNKTEMIFLIVTMSILVICVSVTLQYSLIYIFLLALAIIVILMSLFSKYREKYNNDKLSRIFCALGIILFVAYFINTVYTDFTNNTSAVDGLVLVTLFIIIMCLGWFFEEKKD